MGTNTVQNASDLHPRLLVLFDEKKLLNNEGKEVALSSAITPANAARLTRIVRDMGANRAIEIGLAHGVSALSILHGMGVASAQLVSIDPFQTSQWQGCGRRLVLDQGLGDRHEIIEDMNWFALPELLRKNAKFNFAYIDGDHSFACAFLDFFYIDKMLDVGGVVVFNDCGMPSVQRVVSYVKSNLDYEPVDVVQVHWWKKRRLKFWEYPDLYFRKRSDVSVPWDSYRAF
jgi:predicted O-methyltransferase YrrM